MDLLSEMDTMKHIGRHKNIINFLGCCTQCGNYFFLIFSKSFVDLEHKEPYETLQRTYKFAL